MERALHINRLQGLKYFWQARYQRLYWGPEFCQNLIPSLKDTEEAAPFACRIGLGFSLVTPLVTERGLKALIRIFSLLKKMRFVQPEVIVNDWGILDWINREEFGVVFKIALGRLLVRQNRDPGIKTILTGQAPFFIRGKGGSINIFVHTRPDKNYKTGIKSAYVNSQPSQEFLRAFNVERVELNNLSQGINLGGVKFKKSLYTPYVNIATGRFCPMATRHQKMFRINVCSKECQRYYEILRNHTVPKVVYKRGNTIFYKNPINQASLKEYGIDRVVFQPELPL